MASTNGGIMCIFWYIVLLFEVLLMLPMNNEHYYPD